jgi:S-DNA-T family DNA segregation ATPase FtsK/SpoIIIE
MAEDDLDRDDEYLDDEDEDDEEDDDLSPQRSRPPVKPFGTAGPGGSSSYGASSRLPGSSSSSGGRDTSQLPGNRPGSSTGGYQSRYGTSGTGSTGPFGGSSQSSPPPGGSRPGTPPASSGSGAGRPPFHSGVIGARRDEEPERPEERRDNRPPTGPLGGSSTPSSSAPKPGTSPFRSSTPGGGDRPGDQRDNRPAPPSSSSSSTSSGGNSGGGPLGGFRSKLPGGGDNKPAASAANKPNPPKPSGGSSGGGGNPISQGLGNLRSKLPGGSGGDKKPTSNFGGGASKPSSSGGSNPISQGLGGLRAKLPFGNQGGSAGAAKGPSGASSASSAGGARPGFGTSASSASSPSSTGARFGSAAASSPAGAKKDTKASAAAANPLASLTAKLPFFGKKDEKPRSATTREKMERAAKTPRIDERGLTLDNKLDILGVGLLLASLALFFSSMSATKGQLTEAINTALSQLFGIGAIAVPVVMFAAGVWLIVRHFGDEAPILDPVRIGGVALLYVGGLLLFQFLDSFNPEYAGINLQNPAELRLQLEISYMLGRGGGWIGSEIYYWLVTNWTEAGMVVFMAGLFVIGLMLLLRISAAELAVFVISIYRSFVDSQRRRSQTREARARLRAAELAAAAESRVSISRPLAAELPGGTAPALPAMSSAAPAEESRPIPITMGGRTVTALFGSEEAVPVNGDASTTPAANQQQSVASRLFGAVPALRRDPATATTPTQAAGEAKPAGRFGGLLNRGAKPDAKPAASPAVAQPSPAQTFAPPPSPIAAPVANVSTQTALPVASAAAVPTTSEEPARLGDLLRTAERPTASPFNRTAAPTLPASPTSATPPVPTRPALTTSVDDEDDEDDDDESMIQPTAQTASPTSNRPAGQSAWARPTAHTPGAAQTPSLDERRDRLNAIRSGQGVQPFGGVKPPDANERPQQPAAAFTPTPPAPVSPPVRKPVVFGEMDDNGNGAATAQSSASPAFGRPAGPPAAPVVPPRKRRDWKLPDYKTLLSAGSESDFDREQLLKQARVIEETLQSFGAPGRVVEVNTGPVITQFGVEPDYLTSRSGKKSRVKVGAIAQLDKDLQLAMGARSIRIEAPVPGKGYVGIEVPNQEASIVSLRDVMESDQFQKIKSKSPLAIALGQSVDGTPISADLSAMPHLLIAGTTGSGKSVLVNAIISSMLINNPPDRVKFVMVDPKRVELTGYNGIPHLVAPVVVDLERTVGVLKWVTREMDERYKQFSNAAARNIEDFNKHLPSDREPMPYIVVIIDELADLMMMAPDETERVITRIAALARATGIHLVIATQRPSVDVVTGLIKANFPARVAFAVAGGVDSRVILDQPGAEKLLGKGDMLYLSGSSPAPVRLQGVWVSEQEIENITRYWKRQNSEQPEPHIIKTLAVDDSPVEEAREVQPATGNRFAQQAQAAFWDDGADDGDDLELHERVTDERDELYEQSVDMVRRLNKASVSLLQRRLRIGYTRAARLIDMMEAEGVVGPAQEGSKPREVLPPK